MHKSEKCSQFKLRVLIHSVVAAAIVMGLLRPKISSVSFIGQDERNIEEDAVQETIEEMKDYQRIGYSDEGRFKVFKRYKGRRRNAEDDEQLEEEALRETLEEIKNVHSCNEGSSQAFKPCKYAKTCGEEKDCKNVYTRIWDAFNFLLESLLFVSLLILICGR